MTSRWKLKIGLLAAAAGLAATNSCTINDPFLLSLNLPLAVCDSVNQGNSWNEYDEFNLVEEIGRVSSSYVDEVTATRVNDVYVYMPSPPASGTGTGVVLISLDAFGPLDTLVSFTNVPFDSLRGNGISLRSAVTNPGQVRFKASVLNRLLTLLQSSNGLPAVQVVRIQNTGSTSVAVPQNTQICAKILFQADVEVSG